MARKLANIGIVLTAMGRLEEAFILSLEAAYLFHEFTLYEEQNTMKLLKEIGQKLSEENLKKILEKTPEHLKEYYQSNIQQN